MVPREARGEEVEGEEGGPGPPSACGALRVVWETVRAFFSSVFFFCRFLRFPLSGGASERGEGDWGAPV